MCAQVRTRAMLWSCLCVVGSLIGLPPSISRGDGLVARGPGSAPIAKSRVEEGTFVDRMTAKGQRARGLYITYPYLHRFKAAGVSRLLARAKMDTAVIDLKDDQGRISYATEVEAFKPQVVSSPIEFPAAIEELHEAGRYVIARIVCFNDPHLPKREIDRAILDGRKKYEGQNRPWISWGTGDTWLNPYDTRNHDLFVAMAKEAEAMGFDEVQLDYIRFPVDEGATYANYPGATDTLRRFVILDMLRRIDAEIGVPLSVDVFGLSAIRNGDPTGLGQSLTDWTAHVEAFSPMLYVNAMPGWRMDVEDRGHVLVKGPSYILRQRVGPGPIIRPFMQAFKNGLNEKWNPDFIKQEITGARIGGADGFLFWNPGSDFSMVVRAVADLEAALMPFPASGRDKFRESLWESGQHELSPESERNQKYGW